MRLQPKDIQVSQCYATPRGIVRRVDAILPDGRVEYQQRRGPAPEGQEWPRRGAMDRRTFALTVERPVPCEWTPEQDG